MHAPNEYFPALSIVLLVIRENVRLAVQLISDASVAQPLTDQGRPRAYGRGVFLSSSPLRFISIFLVLGISFKILSEDLFDKELDLWLHPALKS